MKSLEKHEFRTLIKHCFLRGKNTAEAKQWFDKYYGDMAPGRSTIQKWYADFKRGRLTTDDAPRTGRPIEVVTPANIKKIHSIILTDHKVKLREIAAKTKISTERVGYILHECLKMRKLCSQWVPHSLTLDQKKRRVSISKRNLDVFKRDRKEFLSCFVTMDETWIHYYGADNCQKKLLAHIIWDASGIIFIDYYESKKEITRDHYAALWDRLTEEIKQKRPDLAKKTILLHQNNPPVHKSMETIPKSIKMRFELLPHPQYSPDLAPSDYYLFENLKKWIQGKRFESNIDVQNEIDAYFEDLNTEYYLKGIEILEDRWTKCIALKGNFIEE